MKCLFCPDNEIECHDFDKVSYSKIGMLYGATCELCNTYYDYNHIIDSENNILEIIESYTLKTIYKNKRYLLTICDETANLKVVDIRSPNKSYYDGRIKEICEFTKPYNITPFNFQQKLPILLVFL